MSISSHDLLESIMKIASSIFRLALLCVFLVNDSYADITVIRADRMIDVSTGEVISPAAIVVEGNTIKAVNPVANVDACCNADKPLAKHAYSDPLPGLCLYAVKPNWCWLISEV